MGGTVAVWDHVAVTDEPQPFEWNVVPSRAMEFQPSLHSWWDRTQQRIAADRVLRNPTEDRLRLYSLPPEHGLAPLVDLELPSRTAFKSGRQRSRSKAPGSVHGTPGISTHRCSPMADRPTPPGDPARDPLTLHTGPSRG